MRLSRLLPILFTVPALVVGVGLIFHTSFDPTVLGKYSTGYFIVLLAWWLMATPLVYLFWRFLFGTQHVRLSGGRQGAVRPLPKILLAIALVAVAHSVIESRLDRGIRRGTGTGRDRFHPFLQNTPGPESETLHTNAWGFRGDEITREKPPGTIRIFVLGGSTVFCGRTPYEQTHAALLQQMLRERHPDVIIEVLNAGADWHTSQHSLIKFLTYVQDFDPDILIVFHAINDLVRSFVPDLFGRDEYAPDYRHYLGPTTNLVRSEVRWALVETRFGHWFSDFRKERVRVKPAVYEAGAGDLTMFFPRAREIEVSTWASLPSFTRNMTDLVRAATDKGVGVVLASQPSLYHEGMNDAEREVIWFPLANQQGGTRPSIASMIAGMRAFNDASRAIARDHGVTYVDLESMVPRTLEFFTDDVHYTPAGCECIAGAFAEAFRQARLIEQVLAARRGEDGTP